MNPLRQFPLQRIWKKFARRNKRNSRGVRLVPEAGLHGIVFTRRVVIIITADNMTISSGDQVIQICEPTAVYVPAHIPFSICGCSTAIIVCRKKA